MGSIKDLINEMLGEDDDVVNKSKIPAYYRKISGDEDWKLSKDDLDKEENASKDRLEQRKKDAGITKENTQMENIDKDVAAMLNSLKKYDKLVESVAPVLMANPMIKEKKGGKPEWLEKAEEKSEEKEGKKVDEETEKNPWLDLAKKDDKDNDRGTITKTKTGLTHKAADKDDKKKEEMCESADEDVLAWMKRFAKLGNMKGYGR